MAMGQKKVPIDQNRVFLFDPQPGFLKNSWGAGTQKIWPLELRSSVFQGRSSWFDGSSPWRLTEEVSGSRTTRTLE